LPADLPRYRHVFTDEFERRDPAYDIAYVALAAELGCPLITFDRRLGAAARNLRQDD
jgi:predicted nucleic acid-binding protein